MHYEKSLRSKFQESNAIGGMIENSNSNIDETFALELLPLFEEIKRSESSNWKSFPSPNQDVSAMFCVINQLFTVRMKSSDLDNLKKYREIKSSAILSIKGERSKRTRDDDVGVKPGHVVVKQKAESDCLIFCTIVSRSINQLQEFQDYRHRWQGFFANLRRCAGIGAEPLSREKVIGLLGELVFLKDFLVGKMNLPWPEALRHWRGPLGEPQDFIASNWRVEVKATESETPTTVRISNINQLDYEGSNFFLLHIAFTRISDSIEQKSHNSLTLKKMVYDIFDILREFPNELSIFKAKLELVTYRYDDTERHHDELAFETRTWEVYEVRDTERLFPRIRSHHLKDFPGITNAAYNIKLSSLKEFAKPIEYLQNSLARQVNRK